ncbi:MAG: radical SAM protein [Nitrospira sp.]|nr:radical SAM protein [Nitrospira sp.]
MDTNWDGHWNTDHLLAFQRFAWTSIVFSVTRRCPLTCAHCITQSSPNKSLPILKSQEAQILAKDFLQLSQLGLRRICFTGGEPILALEAVCILANEAKTHGISTCLVTSGYWGQNYQNACQTLKDLKSISRWDIGYDEHHEQFLPWEAFACTLELLVEYNVDFSVRVCASSNPSKTAETVAKIRSVVGSEIPIITQSVRHLGRATNLVPTPPCMPRPIQPCISSGPLVREDGSVGPCCSGLAYSQSHNPFYFGNALTDGLVSVWRHWREDKLLRLMRLLGLHYPIKWAGEAGTLTSNFRTSEDVCESCVSLWSTSPNSAASARDKLKMLEVQEKLDEVEKYLFGTVWEEKAT